MARAKKAAAAPPPDAFEVHPMTSELIRVDLYGHCVPQSSGDLVPGWGSAALTIEQAKAFGLALANAVARTTPVAKKRARRKA